jgi:hypothetical protein
MTQRVPNALEKASLTPQNSPKQPPAPQNLVPMQSVPAPPPPAPAKNKP